MTRRTYSRYFADERDVLFAGSERLPGVLAVFRSGFDRWVDDPTGADRPARLREAAPELTDAVTAPTHRTARRSAHAGW